MIKFNTAYRASLKTRAIQRAEAQGRIYKVRSITKSGMVSKMPVGSINDNLSAEQAIDRLAAMEKLNPGHKFIIDPPICP